MLLTLDTASNRCGARLSAGSRHLEAVRDIARGHDAVLPVLVKGLFDALQADPLALQRVIIVTGPGSFAGIRVGIAFGRAMAMAARCPSVGVSAMQALLHEGGPGLVCVLDAKRGQYLVQAKGEDTFRTLGAAEARAALAPPASQIAGIDMAALGAPSHIVQGALWPALCQAEAAGLAMTPDNRGARPLYHRPPDAKPRKTV